ncbi:hypothetical protein [Amycolatopsis sp. NPDC051903]|uniref:hypothetical protein n=1 Tax=Amycolatopsis sp. NPDC051903 TaxID=3363936 RepID=UPI003797CFD6
MIDNLPPQRELPPEVRDRIRHRVHTGLDAARPARRGRPVWLAAAAVVVVATGVVFATGVPRGGSVAPAQPVAPSEATQSLDRCWNAAKPYDSTLPVPSDWTFPFIFKHRDATVFAAMVGNRPLFCEVTLTTVTVSDPDAVPAPVPGSAAKVFLRTADGLVAGLADPAWRGVQAVTPGATVKPDGLPASWFSPLSHQFAVFTGVGPAVPVALGPQGGAVGAASVIAAPAPLTTRVDRPASADRRSEAGRFLDVCLASAQQQVPDRGAYVAGAHLSWNDRQVVVARLGQRVLTCSARPDPTKPGALYYAVNPALGSGELEPGPGVGTLVPVLAPVKDTGVPERTVLAGAVPQNVTRVSVTYPGGRPQEAAVAHGTFAIWHTDADDSSTVDARTEVKAYDAAGELVLEASLKLI